MAWSTPATWVSGTVLTAAQLNTYLRDNTKWLGTDKPHCKVYNSTDQSTTNAVGFILAMDSEQHDVGAMHSTISANSRITVPSGGDGVYYVKASVAWASNATGIRVVSIVQNGTATASGFSADAGTGGTATDMESSVFFAAVAGDYFEVSTFQNSGGALNVITANFYSPYFSAMWHST